MRRAGFFIVAVLLFMQTSVCYGENATNVEFLSYTATTNGIVWYLWTMPPAPPSPGTWVPPSPTPLQWRPLLRSRARMAATKS